MYTMKTSPTTYPTVALPYSGINSLTQGQEGVCGRRYLRYVLKVVGIELLIRSEWLGSEYLYLESCHLKRSVLIFCNAYQGTHALKQKFFSFQLLLVLRESEHLMASYRKINIISEEVTEFNKLNLTEADG